MVLIERMLFYSLGANEIVFEQEQMGNNYFIVIAGSLEVIVNGKPVSVLKERDSFGELALLHDTPRTASIVTLEKTFLWGLDRKTFRSALEALNIQNYSENRQFIDTVPLLGVLTHNQKELLVSSFSSLKFRPKERIVIEGDTGDLFYIIKEGVVSCSKGGNEIRQMFAGDFFGEQALLYNSVRTATITAVTEVKCIAIGRERLGKVLGNQLQHILYQNTKRIALEKSEVLRNLSSGQMAKVVNALLVQVYKKGSVIVPAGIIKGSKMWVILKGKVIDRRGVVAAEVFNCIGDQDITKPIGTETFNDLFSENEVTAASISREEFLSSIGGDFSSVSSNNEASAALHKVQVFRSLSQDRFSALVSALTMTEYEAGELILQQNSEGNSFFIVKSGKVNVIRNGVNIRTITKLDYFGERSILNHEPRTASVVADGPVSCWVLNQSDFFRILDDNIRTQLVKRIQLQDDTISLQDLAIVRMLGKGMFGNVFLAVRRDQQTLFALKTVERRKIERFEIQENLVLERKVLMQLDHIFILRLVKTFKDTKRIYFLTEFVKGMDLFDVLRELNLVTDKDSRFYTANMILFLEHLHERDIIYRDLKPENVMVDEEGYLKLIDFGTAKIVTSRTYTVVGTPHYMAPEIIIGKGYGVAADFWSLGIILYEFLCGGVPFGENEEDPYAIYEKVMERKLIYPPFVDPRLSAKPFIEQLLNKNPGVRTGGSIENLKANPWLSTINWVLIT
jgi:cGMP-dependent protein kinase